MFVSAGIRKTSKDQTVWKVIPLLCFQNDNDLKSAKKVYSKLTINFKVRHFKENHNWKPVY